MTCLVSSVRGVLTPKFSNITLKRYLSLGINKPWFGLLWSLAKGTVILVNDETAMVLSPIYFIYGCLDHGVMPLLPQC
jgi:hypothetical protein